jgi:hypothetical protein
MFGRNGSIVDVFTFAQSLTRRTTIYIDMLFDRGRDTISVVERNEAGERVFTQYPAHYVFYYPDKKGKFTSIFGDTLGRYSTTSGKAFNKEKKSFYGQTLFESDIKPEFRCISDNYLDAPVPNLNVAFFDIETEGRPFAAPNQKMVKIRKRQPRI